MLSGRITTAVLLAASTTNAQSFFDTISTQPDLSLFTSIVQALNTSFSALIQDFAPTNPRTVLVPNNRAITTYLKDNNINSIEDVGADVVVPFLSYHVLLGNLTSAVFTQPGGNIAETKLKAEEFSLLKGDAGQVVYAHKAEALDQVAQGAAVAVKSGFGNSVAVVKADVAFDEGQIHVVDGLLTLPRNCSKTIAHRGAARLVTYIGRVGLLDALDGTPGATCFAPSDAAIAAAAPVLMNMTNEELIDAINFHTLLDALYTTNLTDGMTVQTALTGKSITVNVVDGEYYFNGVRALTKNDIVRNGVSYILDGIMPIDFNGTINAVTSTSPPSTSTMATSTAMSTGGASSSASATTSAATTTGTPNAAGAIRVGGGAFAAGLVALAALV
ncbi:hypothetical protein TWF694_008932 [Orbilia ellipsospora]|uniref:FAS1 domain-containing protein n=1 Tax=Orbilia ellipsospora TaxID=2528407 RepID=A0AAV9XEC4_9PEZI